MQTNQEKTSSNSQEAKLILKIAPINIEHFIPTIAFSIAALNPDFSDSYVNSLIRHNLAGSEQHIQTSFFASSVVRDIERQESISKAIPPAVSSLFTPPSSDNIKELREQVLRQNFYTQQYRNYQPTVIIPWQSGNEKFDSEHEEEQVQAGKRL